MKIDKFDGEYFFLSNFYFCPAPIYDEFGIAYPTVEHFFQAKKSLNHSDRVMIAATARPGEAKRLGRQVKLRPDWEEVKLNVMAEGLRQKFSDPDLRNRLLATGDAKLIEGTTWGDTTWGIDLNTGEGENHLGKLLMELRVRYRKGL